jgi:hypothetical protein
MAQTGKKKNHRVPRNSFRKSALDYGLTSALRLGVRRVYSNIISKFSINIYKLKVVQTLWDSITQETMIIAGET